MKHYNFLGGDKDGLILEETDLRFMVHKSLINDGTRAMIKRYVNSLKEPPDIKVYRHSDTFIFEPSGCSYLDAPEEYLPFAI